MTLVWISLIGALVCLAGAGAVAAWELSRQAVKAGGWREWWRIANQPTERCPTCRGAGRIPRNAG
jgi:hypothetical protein